jgi:hypothetical protein
MWRAGELWMTNVWALAALWLGLALVASLLSIWFRISTALSEIVVGTIAQLIIGAVIGSAVLGTDESWVKFLSGIGAIVLTFLAGAELDPEVFRRKWKEATAVGLAGFFFPFFGCAAAAYYILGWGVMQSWLGGVALSTTSVAVVYAVMIEFGFNRTEYGKTVLAACFINDLGTVLALGFIFAPFTLRTLIFAAVAIVVFAILPWLTPRFFRLYGNRPSELETKFLLLCLLGMGALAGWADSEAVLPAYVIGMVLAGTVGKRPCPDSSLADPDVWAFDALLFHPRGVVCVHPGARGRAFRVHSDAHREAGYEVCWRVPRNQGVQGTQSRSHVHDAIDVNRPYVRHHLIAVRPFTWHYRSGAVLHPCCGRDLQRCCPNADRKCVLFAAASAAERR